MAKKNYCAKSKRPHSIRALCAIESFVGSRKDLAKALGCSKAAIDQWIMKNKISERFVLKLVKLGGGKFSAEELLGVND